MRVTRSALVLPVLVVLPVLSCDAAADLAADLDVAREEPEIIELAPEGPPSWTMENVFAPITGLFLGGPGYWYQPREIAVTTTPPGALLDLFYVRRSFQKRYEQADAPVRIILPSRIEATSKDSLIVRALLDGYRQREVRIRVRSRESQLMIDLEPLPNSLLGFTHTYLAGRGSLTFLTKEALSFRLQKSRQGFGVVLTETANSEGASRTMAGAASALVRSVKPQQLGEDLVVRVDLTDAGRDEAIETRSRQGVDPVRGLHSFALDLVPADGGAADMEHARRALASIGPDDVTGCALEFDATLRERLDPAALARALTPNGSFTDRFLRAAMKRLGEVSPDGAIHMIDGTLFRSGMPIELSAASSQPGHAIGYLALLRRFVSLLEPAAFHRATLQGLLAPELAPARFDETLDAAETRERSCADRRAAVGSTPTLY
jgi:hypothetical protein